MAGLIKNQILKHLSKFTKNLSPDKISLSAMKGEGDLSNLELDEVVLTDLLALPSWIRLRKATCNKVTIKIQWTKLSSHPICLYLDELIVEMETCDVPRTPTSSTPVSSYNKGGKYGFAEQIIDGICLSINSVVVNFRSNKFSASIQVARIMVQSKTPKWQDGDLFMTRLKNDLIGEVMIFKEAEWQTLRIEANALDSCLATTPLRLIANQSKIRITIKKKIADCSIVSSRLQVNLDDLLWVLTDSQLSAAMTFATALQETISRSSDAAALRQTKADDTSKSQTLSSSSSTTSLHVQNSISPTQHPVQNVGRPAPIPTKLGSKTQQQKAKIFDQYNITETSYHLYTGRIDLHLCDDVSPEESSYQRKVDGGAIQLVLYHLEFDIYPYHRAGESRIRWPKYEDGMRQRDAWANDLISIFKGDVRTVREAFKAATTPTSGAKKEVPSDGILLRPMSSSKLNVQTDQQQQYVYLKDGKQSFKPQLSELLESCIVVRVEDFALFRVSTALDSKRSAPKKFLSSDKKQLLLPQEMPSINVVFTEYYFPDGKDFPVPHPNLFIVVNPICLSVDYLTLLWMNVFSLNLAKKVSEIPKSPTSKLHTDICLEALMPRVILPQTDVGTQGRPGDLEGLQLQMSKVIFTNCRLPDGLASRASLKSTLEQFTSSQIFSGNPAEFPGDESDCVAIARRFHDHVARIDDGYPDSSIEQILRKRDSEASGRPVDFVLNFDSVSESTSSYYNMTMNSFRLNREKDVWCAWIDQIWLEFTIVQSSFTRTARTLSLMESFPLVVWLYQYPPDSKSNRAETLSISPPANSEPTSDLTKEVDTKSLPYASRADVYLLMNIGVKIQLQIDHERYSFLMNLLETVARVSEEMEADFRNITGKAVTPQKVVLSAIVREVEVSLLCPPSRESCSQLSSPDEVGNSSAPLSDAVQDNTGSQLTLSEDGILDPVSKALMQFDDPEFQSIPVISIPSVIPATDPAGTMSFEDHGLGFTVELGNDAMSLIDEDPGQKLYISNGSAGVSLNGSRSHSPDSNAGGQSSSANPRNSAWDPSSFSGFKKAPEKLKSINQAFSSFTSKLSGQRGSSKWGTASSRADDSGLDASDSMSVTSGSLSDEDEEAWLGFENQAEMPAFERRGMIQDDSSIAEAENDDSSSGFTARLNKKMVTVITITIGGIKAVAESQGKEISAKTSVENFAMTESGTMEMEKFLQSLSLVSKEFTNWLPRSSGCHAIVKARFDLGQKAEKLEPAAGEQGLIRALVDGIKIKLLATTLKNVSDLFEDNKPSPPNFLMNATLSNIAVTFVDDKIPMYLPEPKNTTIDLFLHRTVVTRGRDGIFRMGESNPAAAMKKDSLVEELGKISSSYSKVKEVSPRDFCIPDVVTADKSTDTDVKLLGQLALESENDHLRQQLEKIEKMPCCRKECSELQTKCESLDRLEAENKELRQEMEKRMSHMLLLKEEREALLSVVQKLQDDLSYSEQMRSRPAS